MPVTNRLEALALFYNTLSDAIQKGRHTAFGDLRKADCPPSGVYFFCEPGEMRCDSGSGPRVVRVGSHALSQTSQTSLWGRLKQHRGNDRVPGGNHRGSIFRLLIGEALQRRDHGEIISWGIGSNAPRDIRALEQPLEDVVSEYLRKMRVLVVSVPDRFDRQKLESGSIALLSNYGRPVLDPPSTGWLGRYSGRQKVRDSGLWNSRDVDGDTLSAPETLEILGRSLRR